MPMILLIATLAGGTLVLITAGLTLLLFGVVVALERLAMPWRRPVDVETRW